MFVLGDGFKYLSEHLSEIFTPVKAIINDPEKWWVNIQVIWIPMVRQTHKSSEVFLQVQLSSLSCQSLQISLLSLVQDSRCKHITTVNGANSDGEPTPVGARSEGWLFVVMEYLHLTSDNSGVARSEGWLFVVMEYLHLTSDNSGVARSAGWCLLWWKSVCDFQQEWNG